MLEKEIYIVESGSDVCIPGPVADAWNRIKSALCGKETPQYAVEQNTKNCVICGCNISLRGYCAGCQTRVD